MSALLMTALLALCFSPAAAADNYDPPGRAGRIRYLQGSVSFQPAGETDWVAAVTNRPMTTGDRLWADAGSRAEVEIGSAAVRMGANTGFSFLNLDDRTVQIQLSEGTLALTVRRLPRDEVIEVDTPNEAFTIMRPGQYRIYAPEDGNSSMVTVRRGEGEVTGGGSTYTVASGQQGTFTGSNALYGEVVSAGGYDDFDNWDLGRDRQYDQSRSARYVSSDLVGYEDLDNNGVWRSDPGYGNVWVPTSVPSGWAPYRYGHWVWVSPWGWTWVDDAPWGYAPFHYGRWVSLHGSWGWVPGPKNVEPVYAPALVAFIGGPGFSLSVGFGGGGYGGNVGWFPLGPREVYVPGYNVSRDYVNRVNVSNTTVSTTTITNVYNNQVTNINTTNVTYANRTVPGAVTAVPQNAFTTSQPVARAAVKVNPQQVAAAPVVVRAAVAPTTNSVLGSSAATANKVTRPPAAAINRPVVAKATPPPPPVPFARQQQALAAHPGQPLAPHEVQQLRPANTATTTLVKPAPPGKPTAPNTAPANQPAAAKPGQPVNPPAVVNRGQPPSPPANRPAPAPPSSSAKANVPANQPQPARPDRPPAAQPPAQQPAGPPAAANRGQPPSPPPANQPAPAPPSTAANRNTPANPPQPARPDRPPAAQPPAPTPANPPAVVNRGEPPTPPPANRPAPASNPSTNAPRPQPQAQPARPEPPAPKPANPPAVANRGEPTPPPANRPAPAPPSNPNANAPHPQPQAQPAHPAQPPKTPAEKAKEEQKQQLQE